MKYMTDIRVVTINELVEIVIYRKPLGLFMSFDNNGFIAVDNMSGNAWTEVFSDFNNCLDWLKRKAEVGDITEKVLRNNLEFIINTAREYFPSDNRANFLNIVSRNIMDRDGQVLRKILKVGKTTQKNIDSINKFFNLEGSIDKELNLNDIERIKDGCRRIKRFF